MARVCQDGQYSLTGSRCRKRATVAIQRRVPFGSRMGPNGRESLYRMEVVFRCAGHAVTEGEVARLPMDEYTAMQEHGEMAR